MGGYTGACAPDLDGVQLRWSAAVVFICPGAGCGRRVAVLYGPGRYFLCRHCYGLSYESQRDNQMDWALHRAQSIRERLGGSANMTQPYPEKPKGMHWKTYGRLWWEHHEAEMEQLQA